MIRAWMLAALIAQSEPHTVGRVPYGPQQAYASIYSDLKAHSIDPLNRWSEHGAKADTAHENAHSVNQGVTNKFKQPRSQGFYIGNGVAYLLPEPRITKASVQARIPRELRNAGVSKKFDMYMEQCVDNQMLKMIEEWVCYVHGARAAWEDPNAERTNHLFSPAEMAVYSVAVLLVVEADDPGYSHLPALRELVSHLLSDTWVYYDHGRQSPKFSGFGGGYVGTLKTLPGAAPIWNRMVELR